MVYTRVWAFRVVVEDKDMVNMIPKNIKSKKKKEWDNNRMLIMGKRIVVV